MRKKREKLSIRKEIIKRKEKINEIEKFLPRTNLLKVRKR